MSMQEELVEVSIPSKFGSEKIAMKQAEIVAKSMGFSPNRIEDLKTSVSEACLNAMEHGNKNSTNMRVAIALSVGPSKSKLKVVVEDKGSGIKKKINEPSIERKIEGKEPARGWGIFLIKRLMDEVKFEAKPGGGNVTTMVIYLNNKNSAHNNPAMESAK